MLTSAALTRWLFPVATRSTASGRRRRQLADLGAEVLDEPIVRDGNIVTSTAPGTAIDVALTLVETLTDAANAEHIRELMGFGRV